MSYARSYTKELLDSDDIPFADIVANMQELNTVNTMLGGHRITLKGLRYLLKDHDKQQTITIAEIGCGGGDNLAVAGKYLREHGYDYRLIGIDIKEECTRFAAQRTISAEWICSDYRDVVWPAKQPDILFSSLFCHHFTDEELVAQLRWMSANCRTGFFINDLHRHWLAYYSISALTKLFSKSYLVKNDAPLSVRRGFTKAEWRRHLQAAGVGKYNISWRWAFRHLICAKEQ